MRRQSGGDDGTERHYCGRLFAELWEWVHAEGRLAGITGTTTETGLLAERITAAEAGLRRLCVWVLHRRECAGWLLLRRLRHNRARSQNAGCK